MSEEVSQQSKDQFVAECIILKTLEDEVCLTINLAGIIQYYRARIGIHPVLESWVELRELVLHSITLAKSQQTGKVPLHIRFVGGSAPVWLVMRIYALCVYEADALFFAGDCLIKI
jgi:hypothetical protein